MLVGPTNWSWTSVSRATSGCGLLQGQGVQGTLWPLAASQPSPDNLNRSSCYFEVVASLYRAGCAAPLAAVPCRELEKHTKARTSRGADGQAGTGPAVFQSRVAIARVRLGGHHEAPPAALADSVGCFKTLPCINKQLDRSSSRGNQGPLPRSASPPPALPSWPAPQSLLTARAHLANLNF